MARRSRQSILKRQREQKRAEKADLKRRKKEARRRGEEFVDEVEAEPVGLVAGAAELEAAESGEANASGEGSVDPAERPESEPAARKVLAEVAADKATSPSEN